MVLSCCYLLPAALSLLDRCAADPAADRLQQTSSAHLLLLRTSMPTAPYCCCCLLPLLLLADFHKARRSRSAV